MPFSIYSVLPTWPGKSQQQVYAEALEQVVNPDRLGYATYSIIEHFFFPNSAPHRTRSHSSRNARSKTQELFARHVTPHFAATPRALAAG